MDRPKTPDSARYSSARRGTETESPIVRSADIEVVQGIAPGHRQAVVELFCTTFPEVITPVFGSPAGCARLLEQSMRGDRVLTAIRDGRLAGFAGLQYSGHEWFSPTLGQLLRVLRAQAIRTVLVGPALMHRPAADTLHLDTLAVRAQWRGQGIGTRLLDAVAARAYEEGKRCVTLDVEDTRPRARALYRRAGFDQVGHHVLPWPWRLLFDCPGFDRLRRLLPVVRDDGSLGSAARQAGGAQRTTSNPAGK